MSSFYRDAIQDNPMLARAKSKYGISMYRGGSTAGTKISIAFVAIAYLVLLVLVFRSSNFVDASPLLFVLLLLSIFIPVTVLSNCIAGEREKRSLELILVAPLTTWQIVVAKLFRAVVPVVLSFAALVPAAVALVLVRESQGQPGMGSDKTHVVWGFIAFLSLSLASAVFSMGVTFFISSMAKTTSASMISTLGILFTWYAFIPIFAAAIGGISREASEVVLSYHPFFAATQTLWPGSTMLQLGPVPVLWSFFIHTALGLSALYAGARRLDAQRSRRVAKSA